MQSPDFFYLKIYRSFFKAERCQMQSPDFFTLEFTDLFSKLEEKKLNVGRCMNMYLTACEKRVDSRQTAYPRRIFGIFATQINNL